jgi:hypothetical protein
MNVKHSGSCGDCIYSLIYTDYLYNFKVEIIHYYLDITPTIDHCKDGDKLRLTKEQAEALIPLIQAQTGIGSCQIFNGEKIDLDLDNFRHHNDLTVSSLPAKYIEFFYGYADYTQPFIQVPVIPTVLDNSLVVCRTARYRQPAINYRFLNQYHPTFVGLLEEFKDFKKQCPHATWRTTKDLYEAARIIQSARLFVGQPSACFAIAEALKVPRVMETFRSNVYPVGGVLAVQAFDQGYFEFVINNFMQNTWYN